MFGLGVPELVVILVVALLIFGPGRLPEIGGALGRGIRDFKRGFDGSEDEPKHLDAEAKDPTDAKQA
jgi:sec-independent protein translocase protein TatA